jgi:hypothetical protein
MKVPPRIFSKDPEKDYIQEDSLSNPTFRQMLQCLRYKVFYREGFSVKVIGFNGSPRAEGNTNFLLERLFEGLHKEGIETEKVQIGGRSTSG